MRASRRPPAMHRHAKIALACVVLNALQACGDGPGEPRNLPQTELPACDLPREYLVSSPVGRNGIPSLHNPELVNAEPSPQNSYLASDDRILGVFLDGRPLAVPHNILWYHEIANFDRGAERIAVTYCPLTGSPLAFDRASVGGQTFGVSGLLFMNNLIMYNRGGSGSLWPQMLGRAKCGAETGQPLARVPVFEMLWRGWKDLYPETQVVSSESNISRNYAVNPYGDYDSLDNERFLYPNMPDVDRRRPVKERVLGLPATADGREPGIAFPYLALMAEPGSWTLLQVRWNGQDVVVFWADQREGGGVFGPWHPLTGERLSFEVNPVRGIMDTDTGTVWSITGAGLDGQLAGLQLTPVAEAYTAFWGAWAAFHPQTRLWEGG